MWLITKLVILISILSTQYASANSTINAYLLEASQPTQTSSKNASLSMNKWDTWVEGSEIRVSDNDIGVLDNQTYALRVKLKNRKQKNAEQELLTLATQRQYSEQSIYHADLLRKHYNNLLNIFSLKSREEILNQQLDFAQKQVSGYTNLVNTEGFNPEKVQQADVNIDRLNQLIDTNQHSLNQALVSMGMNTTAKKFFNRQQLIPVTEIMSHVNKPSVVINNPELDALKLSSTIAKKHAQREKAKQTSAISLFELEYDQNKDTYGATIGIRIPLARNNFDTLMRDSGYQRSQRVWERKLHGIKDNLGGQQLLIQNHYAEYQQEQALLESLELRLKRVTQIGNPELILSLQAEQLKHKVKQQDAYLNILREYITYLSITGQINGTPLRNWIVKGTPRIQG